jgi:hypothetical protein
LVALFHAPTRESIGSHNDKPYSLIHTLNDDVLLHILYVYLLDIKDEDDDENVRLVRRWCRQRWWYKLASVCRRWWKLILTPPSRLDLHLLCTYGVPVAEMLAHSPPLPLTVFYDDSTREMTAEDEEGALVALGHSECLHRIALQIPASKLLKFTTPMNKEFPILERMFIESRYHGSTDFASLETFRAPNLRHIWTSCLPIPSPLPPNTTSLVNLELIDIPCTHTDFTHAPARDSHHSFSCPYPKPRCYEATIEYPIHHQRHSSSPSPLLISRCQCLPRRSPFSDQRAFPQLPRCPVL